MTKVDDELEKLADEQRRRAITAWWKRKSILDFIAYRKSRISGDGL